MLWLIVVSKPLVLIRPPPLPMVIARVDARSKLAPNLSVPRLSKVMPPVALPSAASLETITAAPNPDTVVPPL